MVPPQLCLFEDNSQLHLSQTTMHQQNLQVNQQANTQITNVFTDEASQLLTLQVTAAAAASVAEAQMQAQIQAFAADSVVQQQNARIAQLEQAALEAQRQMQQIAQEQLELERAATLRVQQLQQQLSQAQQVSTQGSPNTSVSTSTPQVQTTVPPNNGSTSQPKATVAHAAPAEGSTTTQNTATVNEAAIVSAVLNAVQQQMMQPVFTVSQDLTTRFASLEAKASAPLFPPTTPMATPFGVTGSHKSPAARPKMVGPSHPIPKTFLRYLQHSLAGIPLHQRRHLNKCCRIQIPQAILEICPQTPKFGMKVKRKRKRRS